jgi:hypothetical protein
MGANGAKGARSEARLASPRDVRLPAVHVGTATDGATGLKVSFYIVKGYVTVPDYAALFEILGQRGVLLWPTVLKPGKASRRHVVGNHEP